MRGNTGSTEQETQGPEGQINSNPRLSFYSTDLSNIYTQIPIDYILKIRNNNNSSIKSLTN